MYILQNEEGNEIYCFIVTSTIFTVTHVRKNGLTKVTTSNGHYGLNLWAELKEQGFVELSKPEVEYPDYDDNEELR